MSGRIMSEIAKVFLFDQNHHTNKQIDHNDPIRTCNVSTLPHGRRLKTEGAFRWPTESKIPRLIFAVFRNPKNTVIDQCPRLTYF